MSRRIVIVGDSPLSVLVGRQLDRDLAREAHIEVAHLTRDESFIYSPHITTLLGHQNFPLKNQLYRNVRSQKTTVKQINLVDQRVITTIGVIDYDAICLDLTPSYGRSEIKKIGQLVTRLINEIQAKFNSGRLLRARVTFAGEDIMSWQMALALAADTVAYPVPIQRALLIQAQYPSITILKEFLADNGVGSRKSVAPQPGLTINPPSSPLKNRLVRGALLDDKDNFVLRDTLNPEGHPESIVVDTKWRHRQNVLKVDQTLAVQIAANIERFLTGDRQRPIKLPRPSGILKGQKNDFVWIGDLESRRLKAKIIGQLDQRFYEKLFRQFNF